MIVLIVLFLAKHAAVLALLLLTVAGAGTLAVGPREPIALRTALGLALCGQACFLLAVIGQLRTVPLIALTVVAIVGGGWRARSNVRLSSAAIGIAIGVLPLFVLTLYPPLAFDETLYHLPFVRALSNDAALRFLPNLRFPVFPQIHELLCVPVFLLAGDVATHLVALVEVLTTAGLLVEWGRRHNARAGWLAAALFLGSPFVVHLATITYVEAALTLFVAAGFYALDRERYALAGLFFGTACSVKYLGWYFAIAALVFVIVRATDRRRSIAALMFGCVAAALPTTAWITLTTGNPVFPFFGSNLWTLPLSPAMALNERVIGIVRTIWDVTFARDRVNYQPPMTSLLIPMAAIVVVAALRDVRARYVLLLSAVYLVLFSFLPHDSRYLVPLLPLVSVVAAIAVAASWPKATTLIAILAVAPGIAYAGYRIAILGMLPVESWERNVLIASRVPAYPALRRANAERVYVCGGEQLKDYAEGELLGDHAGPYSYERILGGTHADGTAAIAKRLRSIDAHYFLVVKRTCEPTRASGGMTLVYEDSAAQLWRIQPLTAR